MTTDNEKKFIEWLNEEIDHSTWVRFNLPDNSDGRKRTTDDIAILNKVKEKFLSITQIPIDNDERSV